MNKIIINLLEGKIEEYSIAAKEQYEKYQYYCWDDDIRKGLIYILKIRSEYKRALKEYKKLCHNAMIGKLQKFIDKYKKHPDKYAEEILGVKLYPYQKFLLKIYLIKKGIHNEN